MHSNYQDIYLRCLAMLDDCKKSPPKQQFGYILKNQNNTCILQKRPTICCGFKIIDKKSKSALKINLDLAKSNNKDNLITIFFEG